MGRKEKYVKPSAQKEIQWLTLARRGELVTLLVLLCVGAFLVARDFKSFLMDHYRVREIHYRVDGIEERENSSLREEEILREAGIQPEQSILTVKPQVAADRIAKMPRVKEVKVYYRLPDKLYVDLTERRTAATVMTRGKYFEIDDTGTVLGTARETLRDAFPLVSPVEWPDPPAVPGRPLEHPAIAEFVEFWSVYGSDSLAQACTVSKIVIDPFGNVETYSPVAKFKVIWGHGEYAEKLQRFRVFWREVQSGKLQPKEYIDLKQAQVLYK